ncbi:MAG: hypothetical protein H7Z12_10515 [Rhodospirillaceae bacterium]|nr:hypothetical protein [Rhodospirillales bacterium]
MAAPDITVADVRTYVRWPDSVPQEFLDQHLSAAGRDMTHACGGDCPAGQEGNWGEAVKALTAASAYPHVHTFTQDGAAAALRSAQMAGSRPHFQDGESVDKAVARLAARAAILMDRINAAVSAENFAKAEQAGAFAADGLFMAGV